MRRVARDHERFQVEKVSVLRVDCSESPNADLQTLIEKPVLVIGKHIVHPDDLHDIVQSEEEFGISVVAVYHESSGSCYQPKIEFTDQGDLVGEGPIETVFVVEGSEECISIGIGIIWRQLECPEVLTCRKDAISVEMLIVRQLHMLLSDEAS